MSFGGDQTGAGGVAPLPDGAATATKQDAQTAAIEAITTTLDHPAQAGEAAAATSALALEGGNLATLLSTVATQATLAAVQALLGAGLPSALATDALKVREQSTVSVTGPLTDAQLRALAVPVSAASLPLPTGAATLAEQQSQTTKLAAGLPTALGAGGGLKVDGSGVAVQVSQSGAPWSQNLTASAVNLNMRVSISAHEIQ